MMNEKDLQHLLTLFDECAKWLNQFHLSQYYAAASCGPDGPWLKLVRTSGGWNRFILILPNSSGSIDPRTKLGLSILRDLDMTDVLAALMECKEKLSNSLQFEIDTKEKEISILRKIKDGLIKEKHSCNRFEQINSILP